VETTKPLRYLAIDVGSKRIGVAVTDELGVTAQPVLTLERRRSKREDLRSIARLCRRFGVAGIVVGNPINMSGEPGHQAFNIQSFASELGQLTGLPIHLWDERLTTVQAERVLRGTRAERGARDRVAATLILQSYLDRSGRERK